MAANGQQKAHLFFIRKFGKIIQMITENVELFSVDFWQVYTLYE